MFKLLISLALFGCAFAGTIFKAPEEPHTNDLDGRIIGGTITTINSFPYQVAIQLDGKLRCGGAIYKANSILTVAHCLQNVTAANLKIRAGSSYANTGGILADVASFKNHDGYNSDTQTNDIAIIKLASPLPLSSTIQPISLATTSPENGAAAVVSGWGVTSANSIVVSNELRYADISIITPFYCMSPLYNYANKIRPGMICAAGPGKDACLGDSGGPLVSGGVLVGLVSWAERCALAYYPGVYTDVATFNSWIVSQASSL